MKKNQIIIEKSLELLFEANKKGVSNYKIAKDTGLTETTIANYLNKKTEPTPANAKILISYFEKENASLVEDDDKNAVYLYDTSGSAGYGSFDEMITAEKIVAKYIIPDFKDVDWLIYVKGSSMYPKYSSGDIIALRRLCESKFIQWGKVYVIATREQGLLVKRLEKSEQADCILAVSDNPSYKPFDIPKDEICGIALVVGVLRME